MPFLGFGAVPCLYYTEYSDICIFSQVLKKRKIFAYPHDKQRQSRGIMVTVISRALKNRIIINGNG